ncbi:MAG: heme exporter protein CcmD [Proteobacteria bacterium]|nr:heme exporter protein CcmD [Pseudomonadota bacterium]
MGEFLAMGGYGAFVWPSYALAAAVLAGLWLSSRWTLKAREAELARLEGEGASRRTRPRAEGQGS